MALTTALSGLRSLSKGNADAGQILRQRSSFKNDPQLVVLSGQIPFLQPGYVSKRFLRINRDKGYGSAFMFWNQCKIRYTFSQTFDRKPCLQAKAAIHRNQDPQVLLPVPTAYPQATNKAFRQLTTAAEPVIQPLPANTDLPYRSIA